MSAAAGPRALRRLLLGALVFGAPSAFPLGAQGLPDAPSTVLGLSLAQGEDSVADRQQTSGAAAQAAAAGLGDADQQEQPGGATSKRLPLCPPAGKNGKRNEPPDPNCRVENQIQPIVTSGHASPLTPRGKAELAYRSVLDPFNLITIGGYAAIAIGANSHSAYGPGLRGFGRLAGYSMVEDMQGEFFGTFLLPSVLHEDPRYNRMPEATVPRRILHAVGHTFVSHHDDGTPMINYATLLTYPISAEMSNLYVPGVATNAASTARRVGIGIATDPAGTIVAEFLPDIAKRIHIHIIFVQEILNQVIVGAPAVQ